MSLNFQDTILSYGVTFFPILFICEKLHKLGSSQHRKWNQVMIPSTLHLKIPVCFPIICYEQVQIASPLTALSTLRNKQLIAT